MVLAAILGLPDGCPIELNHGREVHAVLGQIAGPLRLVPLVFHRSDRQAIATI
jgi:hypothetical protein